MWEMWHWILKIVQHLHKWLINISEVLNARNVTLNPENCPTFPHMAYEYKWSTKLEKCHIKSWQLSNICKNALSLKVKYWMRELWHSILKIVQNLQKWLISISKVLNARKVTWNPENCSTFAQMAYQGLSILMMYWVREMWRWILKIVQHLHKWLINIIEVLKARNVTLNHENCPTFAQMAYEYNGSTGCEKCDIESWKLSNICTNGLSGLINFNDVLNARNVALNPENCSTFAQMAYQYNWSTESEKCDIESWKLSNICTNALWV